MVEKECRGELSCTYYEVITKTMIGYDLPFNTTDFRNTHITKSQLHVFKLLSLTVMKNKLH